jgi:hypothetical protein
MERLIEGNHAVAQNPQIPPFIERASTTAPGAPTTFRVGANDVGF